MKKCWKTCRFMCAGSTNSSYTAAAPHIALFCLVGWSHWGLFTSGHNISPLSTGGCALLESHLAIKDCTMWVVGGFLFWAPPATSTTTSLICPYAHVVLQDMSFHVCWFNQQQLHCSSSTHSTLLPGWLEPLGSIHQWSQHFTALTT